MSRTEYDKDSSSEVILRSSNPDITDVRKDMDNLVLWVGCSRVISRLNLPQCVRYVMEKLIAETYRVNEKKWLESSSSSSSFSGVIDHGHQHHLS